MFISTLSFSQDSLKYVSQGIDKTLDLYTNAVKKLENHDIEDAFNDANEIINSAPNFAKAYGLRGYINYLYKKRPELAIADYTTLLQLNPVNAAAYLYRGYSYEEIGKSDEAKLDYDNAIKFDIENLNSYYRRGICKANLQDFLGAISDYDFILNYDGERKSEFVQWATVYSDRAYCLSALNRFKEALSSINEALRLDNSLWYSWCTRGEIYFKIDEFQKCINDMDRSISIQNQGNAYYYRGLANIKLGKINDGCADLSKSSEFGLVEADEAIKKYCK